MARGLHHASLGHHQKKPYLGREGGSGHSSRSGAELPGLGGCVPPPRRAASVPLCNPRREQHFRRRLPDLFSSCLPGARQGFTQMELPAGACISWGSVHCSGAVYLALGALYIAPGAPCIALGLCTLLQDLCALLWGSIHCSRASVHCSETMYTAPGTPYTAPGALRIAPGLCTLLQGLCTLLSSCSFA